MKMFDGGSMGNHGVFRASHGDLDGGRLTSAKPSRDVCEPVAELSGENADVLISVTCQVRTDDAAPRHASENMQSHSSRIGRPRNDRIANGGRARPRENAIAETR